MYDSDCGNKKFSFTQSFQVKPPYFWVSINPKVSKADLVILAVPAPEVLRLAPELPAALRAALRQIRYDGRVAVALTLEHATYPAVHRRRNGKIYPLVI